MNVIPKNVAAAGFDFAAWREELLVLNRWALGLDIGEKNEEFVAARQAATIARYAEGMEAWNAWASGLRPPDLPVPTGGAQPVAAAVAGRDAWRTRIALHRTARRRGVRAS